MPSACYGADAIAIGTAAMIAAACQQYRVCHTGNVLSDVLLKMWNFARDSIRTPEQKGIQLPECTREELKTFARITGKDDVHKLSMDDLCTVSHDISMNTDIKHV